MRDSGFNDICNKQELMLKGWGGPLISKSAGFAEYGGEEKLEKV